MWRGSGSGDESAAIASHGFAFSLRSDALLTVEATGSDCSAFARGSAPIVRAVGTRDRS
jgi:hypothetical protein